MAKASDNVFPRVIQGMNTADQAAPSDSSWRVYAKANGIFARSSNSVVGPFGTGGGGGVATDTLWDAAGDLAVGTGADTAAKLSIGASGTHLTSNGSTAAWSVPPGTLLAVVLNTAGGNKTTTSATAADVDATNAVVTFTAPASGNVLVRVTATVNTPAATNANAFLGLRESTTDIVNSGGTPKGTFIVQGQTGNTIEQVETWVAYLTGISAGSHTYKLSYAANSSMSFTLRASAANPMTIEVWAA